MSNVPECTGLFYRLNFSFAQTGRGYVFTIRFNKLKRRSCSGCPYCKMIEESIGEDFSDAYDPIAFDYENLKNKAIYKLVVTHWDYEPTDYDGYSPCAKIPAEYEMRLRTEDEEPTP